MKRIVLSAAVVAVILVTAGFTAMHFLVVLPGDLDLARMRPTDAGVYTASIQPEAGSVRMNELHSWILTLKTAAGAAVEDASIAVDGGMPQHGHGLPTRPQATEYLGDGRYRIEGVRFNMSGWWEFSRSILAAEGMDEVTFNLTL